MLGIWSDLNTASGRLAEIASGDYTDIDILCAVALELNIHPSYNYTRYDWDHNLIIDVVVGTDTTIINLGPWVPPDISRSYELTEEELDSLFLHIPKAYEFAVSN